MTETTLEQEDRLSPEQFKAVILDKGWTFREVAARWGISPVWLSQIAGNPGRASHYDDAAIGLPSRKYLGRSARRRQAAATAALARAGSKLGRGVRGNSYRGYLRIGSVLAAAEDVGSIAEMGMRGIVFAVRHTKHTDEYGVIFETGGYDWFSSNLLDAFLTDTGLVDDGATRFTFSTDDALEVAFADRAFNFFP